MDGLKLVMNPLTRHGLISLTLVAVTSCGASLSQMPGFAVRDRLSQIPGLAWLDPVTPVAEAGQNSPQTVVLAGQVSQQLPLVGQGLYQLTDASGSIWVLTPDPPPPVGEPVTLRATLQYESILIQGQNIGEYYAEELERLP
ncbi:MAG: hypothetical protein ACFCVD_08555 [Nodosilinea sp.]